VVRVGGAGLDRFGVEGEVALKVPEVDFGVAAAGEELSFDVRVPLERKALLCVAFEDDLRFWVFAARDRLVLRAVPYVHVLVARPSRDDVWVLWLVAGFVYLARMDDLLHNGEFYRLLARTVPAQLFSGGIVVCEGCCWRHGKVELSDAEVVDGLAGGVRAEQ